MKDRRKEREKKEKLREFKPYKTPLGHAFFVSYNTYNTQEGERKKGVNLKKLGPS
jgi:hypothetical protein